MDDGSIEKGPASRPEWEHLEEWLRGQMQGLIQELLEQEVTEFLGRTRSVRRSESDNDAGYRNGYAPPRRLTLSSGTIRVRRPRIRDTEERFESRLLPLFVHRTREVADLIPELYLHGLSEGDFDLALRGLLGEEAPISASTVARLKDKWNARACRMAVQAPGRPRGGLHVGGRGLREGRVGEGEGRDPGGDGGVE